MIARIWRGRATAQNAEFYAEHVTKRVFPGLKKIAGHRGAYLMRRETAGQIEFLVMTLWDSWDAVRTFAGNSPEVAVVEPEARAVLSEYDEFVSHFDITSGASTLVATLQGKK
jgi:heme-degrading monooxygenase HmoA